VTDTPSFQRIKLSRSGTTAVLSLASDKVNALDREVLREISTCVEYCEQDAEIGALVVTGEGSVFSAGLNVSEVLGNEKGYTDLLLDDLNEALIRLFRCPKPTIAAINGAAIAGGCLLASTCDKRLIAAEARIGVTELQVGVSFPVVAIELLKHACGSRAEQLILDAALLDAEEACRRGLAHQSFPRSELHAAAMSAAEKLASLDAGAYALAKASTRRAALSAMEDEGSGLLDPQVRDHWKDDQTRASLERLLKPKG
jgi:enoyl-CoA hydratase/carnithine racemase